MILIVDDEANHRHMLELHLREEGYECVQAENGAEAIASMGEYPIDLILLDITMDIMDGLTFLSYIRENGDNTPVVIITADSEAKTAVSAMKLGAADYLTKPVDIDVLLSIISNMTDNKDKFTNINESKSDYIFTGVYSDSGLGKIINLLQMVAPTDATVLILGESGTGKELIAKSIHDNSMRASKPFVAVNAAALNDNIIESELFGHVKGAFTGAASARVGRFQEADGGTLFLDEVGELPMSTQVKLLRFLQEKTYEPVGSSKTLKADVRIVAATNQNLESLIIKGEFRQDLYFRLSVFPIEVPPLRERQSEIPILVEFFVKKYAEAFNKKITSISKGFYKTLYQYSFPGNVRELENIVERSLILAKTNELTESLLPNLSSENVSTNVLKDNEKQIILDVLKECDNNKTKAAEKLGISRRGLYNKLRDYGIE